MLTTFNPQRQLLFRLMTFHEKWRKYKKTTNFVLFSLKRHDQMHGVVDWRPLNMIINHMPRRGIEWEINGTLRGSIKSSCLRFAPALVFD